jgi:hypothetical protein
MLSIKDSYSMGKDKALVCYWQIKHISLLLYGKIIIFKVLIFILINKLDLGELWIKERWQVLM